MYHVSANFDLTPRSKVIHAEKFGLMVTLWARGRRGKKYFQNVYRPISSDNLPNLVFAPMLTQWDEKNFRLIFSFPMLTYGREMYFFSTHVSLWENFVLSSGTKNFFKTYTTPRLWAKHLTWFFSKNTLTLRLWKNAQNQFS